MKKEDNNFSKFINLLEKRTINLIENSTIKESCTATLLLIFAAIDSLSKITCGKEDYKSYKERNSGNEKRFKGFFKMAVKNKYMDKKYEDRIHEIYSLRNNIVHTGINAKVILSKNQDYERHLRSIDGNLWINTNQFLIDFKKCVEEIKKDIDNKGQFFNNAKERILDFNEIEIRDNTRAPFPSPGPDGEIFSKK
jgi:hypothetical protein